MRGTLIRRRLAIPTDQEPWSSELKRLLDEMQLDLQKEIAWLNKPSEAATLEADEKLLITSPRMDITTAGGSTVTLTSLSLGGPQGFNGPLYIRKVTGMGTPLLKWGTATLLDNGILILSRHAGTWYKQ